MAFTNFAKDPDSKLDYAVDFTAYFTDGDTIVSAVFEISPVGIVVELIEIAANVVRFWCSGGSLGAVHTVTCRVTTTNGRIVDKSCTFTLTSF